MRISTKMKICKQLALNNLLIYDDVDINLLFGIRMDQLTDFIIDALIDSAKLIPFLFVIYILLEFLDRKTGTTVYKLIRKAKNYAPLLGGSIGIIPQCGLSAAAATLYSRKVITVGTMLAVFLSTSDDMIPIFISESFPVTTMLKILGVKLVIAVISGYIIDIIWKLSHKNATAEAKPRKIMSRKKVEADENLEICTAACCRGNFWVAVLKHTFQVFGFILLVSIVLNIIIGLVGEDNLGNVFKNLPVAGELIAGLIGLIPNCASSVVITQLYLEGVMSLGALFTGLLVNAGVASLVLFKTNKNLKENLIIMAMLYTTGVIWGLIIEFSGFTFLF